MTVSWGMRERLAEQGEASMREVIGQRDLARLCAVSLEQELHATGIERDALIAECEGLRRELIETRGRLSTADAVTRTGGEG